MKQVKININGFAVQPINASTFLFNNVAVNAATWSAPRKVWAIVDARARTPVFVGASLRKDLPLPQGAVLYELPDPVPIPRDRDGKVLADKLDMLVRWMYERNAGKRFARTCERVYREYALAQRQAQAQAQAQASASGGGKMPPSPPSLAIVTVQPERLRIPVYERDGVFPLGWVDVIISIHPDGYHLEYEVENGLPKFFWGSLVLEDGTTTEPKLHGGGDRKVKPATVQLYRRAVRIEKCAPPKSARKK